MAKQQKDSFYPIPQQMLLDNHNQEFKDMHTQSQPTITIEFSESENTEFIGGEEDSQQKQEQFQKRNVPDGGYGWFVVLGCFISHIIIGALERGDGIFFLEFQEKFGLSAQVTAWPGALVSALRLFLGPIATVVCNRYSVRSSCFVGSILVFIGLFFNGFVPNFYYLFLTHFLIQGTGRGLIYGPGLFLVGMYFDKRRGIATGLSSSGVGIGTFVLVPLFQFFFNSFGYQGSFVLIAATSLNLLLSAMLYRPLSLHFKFNKIKEDKDVDEISLQEGLLVANAVEASDISSVRSWKAYHSSKLSTNVTHKDNDVNDSDRKNQRKEGCLKSSLKICFPIDTYDTGNGGKKKLFHFHLLKDSSFLVFCLSFMLFTAAFKSAFTFIPAQVKSLGYSDSEAAMVLSITGVVDTFSRIFFGFLFDLEIIRRHRPFFYTSFIFLIASVSFILPHIEDYVLICVVCGVYGLLTGGFISQKSVVIVDILGAVNIANSFGLLICFQGMGMIIGPPVSGALKDVTGDFRLAFEVGGGLMLCAGCFMILSNIFLRRRQWKEKMEKQKTKDLETFKAK